MDIVYTSAIVMSRQLINLVSINDDTNLRVYFGQHLPGRSNATVMNAKTFPNGVYTPRTTITKKVSMSEYNYPDYMKDEYAASTSLTIFVFNGDTHVGIDHVRMVARADYTIEVVGINPGGLCVAKNYIHTSPDEFIDVWKAIFRGQGCMVHDTPTDGPAECQRPAAECQRPAVGHWG